jgi:hypothetical protein
VYDPVSRLIAGRILTHQVVERLSETLDLSAHRGLRVEARAHDSALDLAGPLKPIGNRNRAVGAEASELYGGPQGGGTTFGGWAVFSNPNLLCGRSNLETPAEEFYNVSVNGDRSVGRDGISRYGRAIGEEQADSRAIPRRASPDEGRARRIVSALRSLAGKRGQYRPADAEQYAVRAHGRLSRRWTDREMRGATGNAQHVVPPCQDCGTGQQEPGARFRSPPARRRRRRSERGRRRGAAPARTTPRRAGGGAIVTQNGLLIIAATTYNNRIRAFDKSSGKVLWEAPLPAAGNTTPATYMVNGRQYIVIACGGGKNDAPSGGSYVAFALRAPLTAPNARSAPCHRRHDAGGAIGPDLPDPR